MRKSCRGGCGGCRRSEIQLQALRFSARTAGKEKGVRCLLFRCEVLVAMVAFSVDHASEAGAAHTLFAAGEHGHAGIGKRLNHGPAGRHRHYAAAAGEHDF